MRLLPRATLTSVLTGASPLVGSRADDGSPRGWISPIEARALLGIEYVDLVEAERTYLTSPERSWWSDAKIVARAAVANALVPERELVRERRPHLVSAHVDNVTVDEALRTIVDAPRRDRARIVHFAHAHLLNLAYEDEALASALSRADLVLPDGIGVRLAARMQGVELRHNVNGTDLFPLLCRRAAERGVPVVLVGAREGIAEQCVARMRSEIPELDVPFVSHGYLGEAGSRRAAARVRALRRVIVLVGMGSPRQELWAWRHLADARGATVLTVGGLFDMCSGAIARAPAAWREVGLEWAWRLLMEPRRMARRYVVGNPLFLGRALAQAAT
ncbi:WecB/TagA/CpsF family glycosyltransferase [Sandaracinus amylolyticus]|uniref:WecB/TagA/CpsF family glycosyltransferase n=1 Tax=Sandaracinus amylolyticus TaxID=927083 RepID=UPI001F0179F7|nr:WecB/TagA/CpsF family glycosyltransferase [Sandaracinus amylolyticus]UJR81178.1 N-acetylglucosaminyldiphosphoundecaprenol N-acetyl-beta-D-mannosaminyltransferase [Sandaracinus amylolyticus]